MPVGGMQTGRYWQAVVVAEAATREFGLDLEVAERT